MSMHLHHPSLSLTGKSKGKKKFKNAQQAKEARDLENSWKELKQKWDIDQEERNRKRAFEFKPFVNPAKIPPGRGTDHIPSLNNGIDTTPARLKPAQVYTGSEMIGIAVLHKSCLQPVFTKDEAINVAKMRR